jgi:hypothetical protein
MRKRTRDSYRTLLGLLARETERLAEVVRQNAQAVGRLAAGKPTWMDYVVVAFTLHNAYSLIEGYFLRVAKFFENEVGDSSWHKDLLQRMTISVEGVRPALLTPEDADLIDDLRGFRHLYRNLYDKKIDPQKVDAVQAGFAETIRRFGDAHARFTDKLERIAGSLES